MDEQLNWSSKKMIFFFLAFFMVLAIVLVGRFTYISLGKEVNGYYLGDYHDANYSRKETLVANRGNIYDRNGKILATNINVYELYAIIDKNYAVYIEDPVDVTDKIVQATSCDRDYVFEKLTKSTGFQVQFGTCGTLSVSQKAELEKHDIKGLGFIKSNRRYYPNSSYLSHVIGYTETDQYQLTGVAGVEAVFDDVLSGTNGARYYFSDRLGEELPGTANYVAPVHGADVYLTIDLTIQYYLEKYASDVFESYTPEAINAMVTDPKTGEVLATVSYPNFDLNNKDIEDHNNHIATIAYEPGSIMKPYVYATAIDKDVYVGTDRFSSGSINFEGHTIGDWNDSVGWGNISYDEGLYRSSNVSIVKLLTGVTNTTDFSTYLNRFGFGKETGIEVVNEAGGKLPTDYFTLVTAGFGQGLTTTPSQHVQAFSAFVNDGTMIKPSLLYKTKGTKNDYEFVTETVSTPISKATADYMRVLLTDTIESEYSAAKSYRLNGYSVMGKTGTAQIAGEDGQGYLEDVYYSSFIGAAPAENPELLMYVGVKKPNNNVGSNHHASGIFTNTMHNALKYLENKEDVGFNAITPIEMVDLEGKNVINARTTLLNLGLNPIIVGTDSAIEGQFPAKGETVAHGSNVFIFTGGKKYMPNLEGMSLREVLMFAEYFELDIKFEGYGFVESQSITSGVEFDVNDTLLIKLSNRWET